MSNRRHPKGYWTKERCHKEAKKYESRTHFNMFANTAYVTALREGWMDELCSHMVPKQKEGGYWTFERCKEEALKYETRSAFNAMAGGAYGRCVAEKWLDKVCVHMDTKPRKPRGYWTRERITEEALKYMHRRDFRINASRAYNVADTGGWLNDICSHMES